MAADLWGCSVITDPQIKIRKMSVVQIRPAQRFVACRLIPVRLTKLATSWPYSFL